MQEIERSNAEHCISEIRYFGRRRLRSSGTLAAGRLNFRVPRLITSDEYKPYKKAILKAFGEKRLPKRTGRRGRPRGPRYRPKKGLAPYDKYGATVHKTREKGRVVKIDYRTVFGTRKQVERALKRSTCSRKINTSFIERHNGTDRNRCSRKVRKSYCFSKDWDVHRAATCSSVPKTRR